MQFGEGRFRCGSCRRPSRAMTSLSLPDAQRAFRPDQEHHQELAAAKHHARAALASAYRIDTVSSAFPHIQIADDVAILNKHAVDGEADENGSVCRPGGRDHALPGIVAAHGPGACASLRAAHLRMRRQRALRRFLPDRRREISADRRRDDSHHHADRGEQLCRGARRAERPHSISLSGRSEGRNLDGLTRMAAE
jgi:hypothetical protein